MGLESCKVEAIIAVSDMAKAKDFYEGTLGLPGGPEGMTAASPINARRDADPHLPLRACGQSAATLAAWSTDDVEGIVAELSSKGIQFEQYDTDQIKTDERGIARFGADRIAWFKDPDGNTLGVGSP